MPVPARRSARARVAAPLPRTAAVLAVALLALGLPALAASPATARPAAVGRDRVAPSPATVTVTGVGSATARPDLAVIGAGVEAVAKTPQAALNAQSKAADALLAAVRRHGVADGDIRTESLSLGPVNEYQNGTSQLTGYQAAQSFSVKVRDIAATGGILQAITDATGAAGRINSVVFDVSDPTPLHRDARAAAHEDAHSKALQYARLSGHRLGRLVSLTDATADEPRPAPVAADLPAGVASGVPVAPGEIRATVTVTAVYELD